MATQYKTPGVYIQEPDSFPPSIVGVETAVPCFIGYTEFAVDTDKRDLLLTPKRIESMAEYVQCFGRGSAQKYFLAATADADNDGQPDDRPDDRLNRNWGLVSLDGRTSYTLVQQGRTALNLYNSMRLFYANGGGPCWVISVGGYVRDGQPTTPDPQDFLDGLAVGESFVGPTMVAIPDAMQLANQADFNTVTAQMLRSCAKTGDRMALLDVWGANTMTPRDDWKPAVEAFRTGVRQVPQEMWRFGAAYFPPLATSVVPTSEIDISNFAVDDANAPNRAVLQQALYNVLTLTYPAPPPKAPAGDDAGKPDGTETKATDTGSTKPADTGGGAPGSTALSPARLSDKGVTVLNSYVNAIGTSVDVLPAPATQGGVAAGITHKQLTAALTATVPGFQNLLTAIAATQGVLPTSGAMAGVWASNDATRGVWNAPANTGIATLVMPKLPVAGDQQDDLNVPVQGLAVNAIHTFQGRGSLIWGARTLDSQSNDWRYIQVRRTMIYVEQSVKQALDAMVFRPNTAQTWVTVTSMIESFLHGLWASGGLMGNAPAQAYNVVCGLGSTMTPDDVLNGVMRVQITLQMVRPAEFILLTFKQQMQAGG
ncbi:phage tail sheath family protein [Sphingomonas xinjiangensis]|uniref:Tail sheath protein C-terminal domain-containing protein n=1 Tax=Sphingomonas xinjiangensis TaxID=643568 RepID=A0A840YES9_9SPHN|nr:phage tail sheath family protein [Sphingomonas xinjiangensis]MBB5710805.1 hypothetical protein [Sphingomonas xinjiangensis]